MDRTKRIEGNLQQQIALLRNLEVESSTFVSEDDHLSAMNAIEDALQLARNPRDIHRFLKCIGWVEDIIEIYSSQGKEARRRLINSLVEVFMDHLTSEETSVCVKMELSRVLNVILEGCSHKIAQELLKGGNFITKIENLFLQISSAGDFELQVMLIESILRLTPQKSLRENFFKKLITDKLLLSSFLNIRDTHFDVDCRKFLNQYNRKDHFNRIYSFAVETVKLDGEQLYKPEDEGYDDFWIDFNTGSKRISLFCQSTLLPSQLSQNKEPRWETLSLRASDVHRYNCDVRNKFWVVTVELKVNAQMLTNKEREKQPHLFMCQLSQRYDVQTALNAALKLEKQKSSVPQSLFLPQRDINEGKTKFTVQNQPDDMTAPSQHQSDLPSSSREDSSQKKCSTPIELLNLTSSISSTDGSRHLSWQSIHDRMNQKNPRSQSASNIKKYKELIQSCETPPHKKTSKCSIANVSAEIELRNNLTKDSDQSVGRKRTNVQSFNNGRKLDDHKKANEKQKPRNLDTNIYQSPVTASGDFVCPLNKLGIPSSVEKKVPQKMQEEGNTNVPECQAPLKELEFSRKGICVEVEDPSTKACDTGGKNSRKQTTGAGNLCISTQGADPSLRKSSLRSGKRVMTHVVTSKPKNSKNKQKLVPQKDTKIACQNKPSPKSIENESLGKIGVVKNKSDANDEIADDDIEEFSNSGDIKECRQPNNAPVLNKYITAHGSFDAFKAPETFNVSKDMRKNKKKNQMKDVNQNSTDLITKSMKSSNRVLNQSNTMSVKSKENNACREEKISKAGDKKINTISKQNIVTLNSNVLDSNYFEQNDHDSVARIQDSFQLGVEVDEFKTRDEEKRSKAQDKEIRSISKQQNIVTLNSSALDSNDFEQNDHDSVAESPDSFQLCVNIDDSKIRDEAKEISQDFVCETQFDKGPGTFGIAENKCDLDVMAKNQTQNQNFIDDKIDDDNCENMTSSKQSKLADDTQASISLAGSYVFKNSGHREFEKTGYDKMDTSKEMSTAKKNKQTNQDRREYQASVTDKAHVPFTKKVTDKKEQAENCTNKCKMKDNSKGSDKITKATQKINDMVSTTNARYKRTAKALPETPATATLSKDVKESHDNSSENDPNPRKDLSCIRNLRARNKDICYTECDSTNGSSLKFNEKDEAVKSKMPSNRNMESKITDLSFFSTNMMDTSPSASSIEPNHKTDDHEYQLLSMNNESSSQSYRIWKSQEIKTTVTTMPLDVTSDHRLKDPYDFNSECMRRLHDTNKIVPYESNSLELYNYASTASKPSQKDKHRKSKTFSESTQNVQKRVSSTQSQMTTQVEFKKHIWKCKKVRDKEYSSKPCLADVTPAKGKTHGISNLYAPSSFAKDLKDNKSSHHKEDKADNNYGGGLVFPHLKDSIPCTPYNEREGDDNESTIDTLSRGTQLSWIAKEKTTSAQRKKMRGKTYGHNGKMYDKNYEKTSSLFADKPLISREKLSCENDRQLYRAGKQRSSKPRRNNNKLQNAYNPTVSPPDSPRDHASKREQKRRDKKHTSPTSLNSMNKVLKSTRIEEKKTPKRKLSFEGNSEKGKRQKTSAYSEVDTISSIGYSFDSSYCPKSDLSSKTEVQHSSDKWREGRLNKDFAKASAIKSGPSSTRRMNKSALKRKYPSISSDSMQELYSDSPPEMNDPKLSRFLPRKLFDSDMTLAKDNNRVKNKTTSRLKQPAKVPCDILSTDAEKICHPKSGKCALSTSSYNEKLENSNYKWHKDRVQNKMTISTPLKKKVSRSRKSPKEILDGKYNRSISSPEIARGNDRKARTAFKKPSDLNFGFSPGAQLFDDSPGAVSSKESFIVDSPLKDDLYQYNHIDQEGLGNDAIGMGDEDYDGPYNALSALVQMEKANSTTRNQICRVSDTAEKILKSANDIIQSARTEGQDKRSKAMSRLDQCLRSVIDKAERFSQEIKETESQLTLLLTQHVQKIKAHREHSEQCLESLKLACRAVTKEMHETQTDEDKVKKSVKAALKKDFDALAHSVKTKFNEHSLEAMRRCLQASFLIS